MNADSQLLRIKEVSALTTFARSTIWAKVAAGEFPQPIKLSHSISVWRQVEVESWINERASARSS